MMKPNNQLVFKVFDTDYDELGEMFAGLSVDDVLDGMEGTQNFVEVTTADGRVVDFTIGFDRTRNSIALLDDGTSAADAELAYDVLNEFAAGKLAESLSASSADNFVAILDGNTSVFHYWA